MAHMRSFCSCPKSGCSMGVVSHSAFCIGVIMTLLFCLSAPAWGMRTHGRIRQYSEQNPVVYIDSWHNWPYAFISDNGEPEGLSIDIVRRVMTQLGLPYVIRLVEPNEMSRQLLSGEADVTIAIAEYHNLNYGEFGKTTLALSTNSVLMPRRDSTRRYTIEKLHDLKGLTVKRDSRAHRYLLSHGFSPDEINVIDNMDDCANQCVARGQGGIVWNTRRLHWWLNKYKVGGYRLVPVDIPNGKYRFIAGDTALLARLDSIASIMQRSGALSRMEDKWMFPEEKMSEQGETYLFYGAIGAIGAMLIAVLLFYLLRRRRRRRELDRVIKEMRLSLRASGARVWVYYPQSHTFAWMNEDGETLEEYLSFDFSRFYPEGEFNTIYYHIKNFEHHNGAPVTEVVRCYTSDDENDREARTVQVRMTPILDEYANIYLVLGLQYDIDFLEKDGKDVQLAVQRYKNAAEYAIVGVMCFDADGMMTDINQRALYIFGLDDATKAVNVQCNIADILGPYFDHDTWDKKDTCFTVRVPLDEIAEVFPFADPNLYRTKAVIYTAVREADYEVKRERWENPNRYFYVRVISANDEEGNVLGYRLYVRDITDQVHVRRATARLKKRIDIVRAERDSFHDYSEVLMRRGEVDTVRYEIDKHKVFFNGRRGTDFHTFTQLQLLGIADQRDIKRIYRAFSHMDNRTPRILHVRFRTRLRDEERHRQQFDVYMRPRFDKQGEVVSYFGFVRNITKLSYMRRKLEKATKKAAEAEHLQQNFLRNMSYAIRQPLFAIQNSIERYMNSMQDDQRQQMLDNIKGNTHRLINLSDDTLLLSRLEAGMFQVRNEELDFVPLFERTVKDTFDRYDNPQLTLHVDSPYDKLMISADTSILRRIIQEAVELSARYTKAGEITVRYYTTRRRQQLTIVVEDNGQGIPPQVQSHIFELQSTDALSADQPGANAVSGLEIPICHALVKVCGGKMEIESEVGEGTSIYIELPIM